MTDGSALYVGEVTHSRVRDFRHRLNYRVWMVLLDLDRLDTLQQHLKLLCRRAFGLISFLPSDHGDGGGGGLREQIEARLIQAGIDLPGGPIRLLTMPRILGYGFNPISVFFCHRPDESLGAVIYEVTNTFRERHSYVIAVPADQTAVVRQTAEKALFVSPFMDQALTYDFTVTPPGDAVSVVVTVRRGETPVLTASFSGDRRDLTDRELLRAFLTHPLLTWKVTWGIHWEAVKVMLKGARYRVRGAPPACPVSTGAAR